MDEQRFRAVAFLDVGLATAGLEIEDRVGVKLEGFEDAIDFGVLGRVLVSEVR
jgi:hypothetical protein